MSAFLGRDKGQMRPVIACAQENGVEVLCLQEVMDFELKHLEAVYNFVRYVPMTLFEGGNTMGLVMCTDLEVRDVHEQYYVGNATELKLFDESTPEQVNNTKRRPLLTCTIEKNNLLFDVGNTHFLYLKDGKFGDEHEEALDELAGLVSNYDDDIVLCAAMVTARGSELYNRFLQRYVMEDWVPESVKCTLDPNLHKLAPKLKTGEVPPVVVDYIFGCGANTLAEPVRQFLGVSDHTPLLAVVL